MTALIDSLSASENFKNTGTIMDFEEYGTQMSVVVNPKE